MGALTEYMAWSNGSREWPIHTMPTANTRVYSHRRFRIVVTSTGINAM
jgi:hypothetical protein